MNNQNNVSLIDWYGGDKAIARAAWVSTQIDVESRTDEQIRDLIVNKLWNNAGGKPHKTPFERGLIEVKVTLDQASHIHALKHRLANINGESARYMELKENKFLIPNDWNVDINLSEEYLASLSQESRELLNSCGSWNDALVSISVITNELYHASLNDLSSRLGRKRAKESARFFKTMNSQINLSIMMNMSCFNNFYNLRAADDAQLEIQYIAEQMLECIKNIPGNPFKHTLEAMNLTKK